MMFELIWHGPVRPTHYNVEADNEEDAQALMAAFCMGDYDGPLVREIPTPKEKTR